MQAKVNKYTFTEIARLTGLHRNTIKNYHSQGKLKAEKETRGGNTIWVVSEHDLYHSGIPRLMDRLPRQGGQQPPTNSQVKVDNNGLDNNFENLINRVQELSMKLGGYEYAAKALNEAKEEREEYRQKYLNAEEENILLQKRVIELQARVYTPWWRHRIRTGKT